MAETSTTQPAAPTSTSVQAPQQPTMTNEQGLALLQAEAANLAKYGVADPAMLPKPTSQVFTQKALPTGFVQDVKGNIFAGPSYDASKAYGAAAPVTVSTSQMADERTGENVRLMDQFQKEAQQRAAESLSRGEAALKAQQDRTRQADLLAQQRQFGATGGVLGGVEAPQEQPSLSTFVSPEEAQMQSKIETANKEIDDELKKYMDQLDEQMASLNTANQAAIKDIQAQFEKRRAETRNLNDRVLATTAMIGTRSGRARYAPDIQSGIVSEQEQAAISRLSELDAQEKNVLEQAKYAQSKNQWELLDRQRSAVLEAREAKNKVVEDLQKQVFAEQEIRLKQEKMVQQKADDAREQDKATGDALALSILSEMPGGKMDDEILQDYADAYGIDAKFLKSSVLKQQQALEKERNTGTVGEYSRALEQNLIPQDMTYLEFKSTGGGAGGLTATQKEYQQASEEGFKGTLMDFQKAQKELVREGLTPSEKSSLRKEIAAEGSIQKYGDLRNSFESMNAIVAQTLKRKTGESPASGDQALVTLFNKMLDPTSVVREGEYARTAEGQSLLNRAQSYMERLQQGGAGITDATRKDMANVARTLFGVANKANRESVDYYVPTIKEAGEDPSRFIKGYVDLDQLASSLGVDRSEIEDAMDSGYTMREIQSTFGGGSPSGGGTSNVPKAEPSGSLSEKYESGGNPGAIGYDRTGGYSYGVYQLAHNRAKSFVDQSPYSADFKGIPFNSAQFQQKWKQVAKRDPQGFASAQKEYIVGTHYQPQIQKLASAGFDVKRVGPALKEVIFSTAVQHGANNDVITSAIRKVGRGASERDLIKAIYDERWSGGRRFGSSTPAVRASVQKRFFGKGGELERALAMASNKPTFA